MLFYSGFVFCFLYSWFPNVDNNPYTNYNIDLGIINKPNHLYIPYGERIRCLSGFYGFIFPTGKRKE